MATGVLTQLKAGDKDTPTDHRIAEIQSRLGHLALFGEATGNFDPATTTALHRFQWYMVNRPWRLRVLPKGSVSTGLIEPYSADAAVLVTGAYDLVTETALQEWVDGGYRPTSPIVRLALGRFANLERAAGFTQLIYPGAQANEVLVNEGFVGGMAAIDRAAGEAGVTVRINQTFRPQGVAPSGAIVPPATRSQHLIGHAMDGNFVDGAQVVTAAILLAGSQSKAVSAFIAGVKAAGLRWGGDFARRDPIHFDLEVPASTENYTMHHFFAQRAYSDHHPMRPA